MRATDMTVGKPARLIVAFALPMMLGNVCQQLYIIVDGAFVGRFAGIDALAAVGAADWLSWIFMGVITGFSQGFSIRIAQRFGAHDEKGLRRTAAMTVKLTFFIALGLLFVSQALIGPLLSLLRTPEDIFPKAEAYLRILMAGLPIIAAYNAQAAMLHAVGDSKTPLWAMLIASLCNMALDGVFVIWLRWGVAGAAGATLMAQCVSALYCFRVVRGLPMARFERGDFAWDKEAARRLIRLGTPTAAQNMVIGLGGLAVQRVINEFGSVFIAGFTATNKLYGLMEMAAVSLGGAVASYTGQNYGAGSLPRIKSGVRAAVGIALCTSLAIAALLFLTGRQVLSLFVDPGENMTVQVLDVAERYLRFMLAALWVLYLLYVFRSALQGLGDTVTPMLSGVAELVMRVGAALLLPRFLGRDGIYFAEPAAWLGAELLLMTVYYRKLRRLTFQED